jgi:cell division protein FtsL
MAKNYYVNGNTVRELEAPARQNTRTHQNTRTGRSARTYQSAQAQPAPRTRRNAQAQPNPRTRQEIEEAKRRKRRRNAARRNRQRAMEMSRGYVVFLSICVAVTAAMAGMYIHMQSQVTSRMKSVAALQSQVIDLQADNDARYKSLTSSVDLNHVKDVAINELGMQYPKEDQVIYYSIDNSNFMDQYDDIP